MVWCICEIEMNKMGRVHNSLLSEQMVIRKQEYISFGLCDIKDLFSS